MNAILKFGFQKKKTIKFSWSKLYKLHKKDSILHVTTTLSLKQGKQEQAVDPFHPLNFVSIIDSKSRNKTKVDLRYVIIVNM